MKAIHTLPDLVIDLDGAALAPEDARTLTEVVVQQRLCVPALCQLRLVNPRGPLGRPRSLPIGASLRVAVRGQSAPLFVGEVTAIEHVHGSPSGHEVRIRGYDLLHRLRKRQPVRLHVQVTLADLARELVTDLGYTVEAADAGPLWQTLMQWRHSDLDLLTEMAQRCGLYFTVAENVLRILTLKGSGVPVPLELGVALSDARLEANANLACRSVSTFAWDPLRVEEHRGAAGSARVGRDVAAGISPESVGGLGAITLVDQLGEDDQHADALAQAELDSRAAREVTFRGQAEGDARLRPGAIVDVRGVAAPFEGQYVLASVNHVCDSRQGFVSEIDSTPPVPQLRSMGTAAAFGVVSRIDDPDRLGRIQVAFPTFDNLETGWMMVLAAGAGAGKGLMALADVGDQVLVLFPQGDPAQGVVLGGLYGKKGPPDTGVEGGAVRRYTLLTPGGQKLQLDDHLKAVRMQNSSGSYVELTPERVRVHAEANLEIEAPGRQIVIRGKTIDFQRG